MHAFTNCEGATYGSKIEDPNAETNLIGYALDGVAVFAPLDHESTIELDELTRVGVHAKYGEVSVARLVELLAGHDEIHYTQITNTIPR